MAKSEKKIRMSDESLNSYGFWVKTDGIDLTDFIKNPIMLWNHNRAWRGTEEEVLPIGKWEDFVMKDSDLEGFPNFSDSYEFAQKIAKMFEEGTLNASSIGIVPLEWSESPELLKEGQRYATVTKCKLLEVSICDIPSNKNAVVLYDNEGSVLNLTDAETSNVIPLITKIVNTESNMKKLLEHLKLNENTSDEVVVKLVKGLEDEITALKTENGVLKEVQTNQLKAQVKTLLDDAEKAGKINAATRPSLERLFLADFEAAKITLEAMQAAPKFDLTDFTKGDKSTSKPTYEGKTWMELSQTDSETLQKLKDENFELFKLMYKADMGVDWIE
jgi:Caudovirus prohead serine protease